MSWCPVSSARQWRRERRRAAIARGEPVYLGDVLALAPRVAALGPGIYHVDCYHDDWCASNRGGVCDCEPWVRLRGDPADN